MGRNKNERGDIIYKIFFYVKYHKNNMYIV